MLTDCAIDIDKCGCSCHRTPGVMHAMPCCAKPPLRWTDLNTYEWDLCELCKKFTSISEDRQIYHKNNHQWPGYAGRDETFGGTDF